MVNDLGMQDLPPVPEIEAVLEPNQVPQEVGVVSSVSGSVVYMCFTRGARVGVVHLAKCGVGRSLRLLECEMGG